MKEITNKLSRRRFLAAGSLGAVGLYSITNTLGPRAVQGVVADIRRKTTSPLFLPSPADWNSNGITAAWLGHSSVLLDFYGVRILTDPVLFNRIGADTALGTVGPKRLVSAPLKPGALPRVDLVLLSHAHMDHLDPASLRALPGRPFLVTAKSTTDLIPREKFRGTAELTWGDRLVTKTPAGDVEVRAFEVKHWGARWRVDTYRGYNGYVIAKDGKRILFGGDTALTNSFAEVKKYGPFELAIMPIGAYQPFIWSHCSPEQAVDMANAAGAAYILPIHHKTFPLGREGTAEPVQRLRGCIEAERIGWTDVGQTFSI